MYKNQEIYVMSSEPFRFGSWSCEKALAEPDRPAAASLAAWLVSFCQFWLFCHLGAGLALSGTGSGVMMTVQGDGAGGATLQPFPILQVTLLKRQPKR